MNMFKHFRLHAGEYTPRAFRKTVSVAIFVFFVVLAATGFIVAQTNPAQAATGGPQPPSGQTPPRREPIPPVIHPTETPAPGCEERPRHGDLRAVITDSPATTSARFTNRSDTCSYRIGLAVYMRFDNNIDNQELYDYALAVIAPNSTLDLSVSNPPCAYQGDAFWGDLITSFRGGVRYGERRLADTDGVNTELCVRQTPTATPVALTETPIPPSSTPAPPTETAVPPSNTPVPPSATSVSTTATRVPPSNTPIPPSNTPAPPSATSMPATATATVVPPSATSMPATATSTAVPPTATNTLVPPTTVPAPSGGSPPGAAPPVAQITAQVSMSPPSRPAPVSQARPLVGSNPETPPQQPVSQARPLVGASDEQVSASLPRTGMGDTLALVLAMATLAGLFVMLGLLLHLRATSR